MERNPEEFSDLAEYYVEGEDKFYSLKVKASVLLQALAEKVDGALRNMIDIVTMIMIGALEQSEQDSPIFAKIKYVCFETGGRRTKCRLADSPKRRSCRPVY